MSAISWLIREIIAIILTILAIMSLPFSILLIPVYLCRPLVGWLARMLRADLGKMLSARGNLFAVELSEMYSERSRCTIFVSHMVDGKVCVEEFRKSVLEKVVRRRGGEEDGLLNPELQQELCSWMGYVFWKWEEDFKIEKHVRMYEGPGKILGVTDHDIAEIGKELAGRAFKRGQSPWEFWIWNEAKLSRDAEGREKSIILLRVHHSLADGYAVLKLLLEDLAGGEILADVAQPRRRAERNKFVTLLSTLLKGPYELISLSIHSWDLNEWHVPERRLAGRLNTAISEPLPIEEIKEIRKMYSTTFNGVIQAAFTGGLRKFMMEEGLKVPQAVHCMTPLPVVNHPKKLRNHMTAFVAPLPVGIEEPVERMREVDRRLKKLHGSSVPLATFYMLPLVGSLPAWVIKILATNKITTCLMTNFPATLAQVYLLGHHVDDIIFGGGLMVGNIGIGFNSLSYNGHIRFGAGIDEGVVKDPKKVKSLIALVVEELDILRSSEIV